MVNILKDKDLNQILTWTTIYGYSWVDRHVILSGKLNNRADLDTLETICQKATGGAITNIVPGGEEKFQDLTTNEANVVNIAFDAILKTNSDLRDGYYLLLGCEFPPVPGTKREFRFILSLFWIGTSLTSMNVYYTITVDGTSITLISVTTGQEMFDPGDFSLVVKNDKGETTQPNFDLLIGTTGTAAQSKDVVISRKGSAYFKGIVENVEITNETITVTGRGNAIKLVWDTCDEWEEFVATAANSVFDTLLTGTGISQDATDKITTQISVAFQEGENIYRAIYGTVKNYLNAECFVDTSDVLHTKTTIGTDKSGSVTLEHGVNILSLSRKINSIELVNWVKVRGSAEGIFSLTSGPAEDTTSQAAYGTRKQIVAARESYHQDQVDNMKTNVLADKKDPIDILEEVLFLDSGDYGLVIGDTITITNSRLGVSGTYRIFGLSHTWASGSGEIVTATISNTARSVEKEIANLSFRLDVEKFYPQGSPLWIPLNIPLYALDVDEDLVYKFDVPDVDDWDVRIHDFKVTIYMEAYRTWQKTGQSTTHNHATTNQAIHTHETDGWDDEIPSEVLESRDFLVTVPTSFADIDGQNWDPVLDTGLFFVTLLIKNNEGTNELFYARLNVGGIYYPDSGGQIQNIDAGGNGVFNFFYYMRSGNDENNISVQWKTILSGGADVDYNLYVQKLSRHSTTLTGGHSHTISSGGGHTHPVVEGIEAGTAYPVDVEVWLNGTKIADKNTAGAGNLDGGSSKTVRDIDLSSEITTGTNTLRIKTTGASSKGMVGTSGGGRIFVRSKA